MKQTTGLMLNFPALDVASVFCYCPPTVGFTLFNDLQSLVLWDVFWCWTITFCSGSVLVLRSEGRVFILKPQTEARRMLY